MGDKFYTLQVQNHSEFVLKVKTYRTTQPGNRLLVDSLVLNLNDKLEIGTTHSCSTINPLLIRFDSIEIFDSSDKSRRFNKEELSDYLQTMEKADCSTYLIR